MAGGYARQHIEHWGARVSLGYVPRIIPFNKFGRNDGVSTSEEDIWEFGGSFTFLETGTTLWASCSDNTNGQGQIMLVTGLDENWSLKTEYVALTGTTPVQIGAANSWVHVLRSFQVGPTFSDPVGDVYIAADGASYIGGVPQEQNLVQAYVNYTNAPQQTEHCFGVVPAGYKALIFQMTAEMYSITSGSARSSTVALEVSEPVRGTMGVPTDYAPFRRVSEMNVSTAEPIMRHDYDFPLVFEQYARVSMRATATASSSLAADISALLVPEDYPTSWNYRTAVGDVVS